MFCFLGSTMRRFCWQAAVVARWQGASASLTAQSLESSTLVMCCHCQFDGRDGMEMQPLVVVLVLVVGGGGGGGKQTQGSP